MIKDLKADVEKKGENITAEEMKKRTGDLQQGSLKLFEMVYKKVI